MKDNGVTVICYVKEEHWESRQKATEFYLECMMVCEGSEQERYEKIYTELLLDYSVCTDE